MATNSNISHLDFVKNSSNNTTTPTAHCSMALKMRFGNGSPIGKLLLDFSKMRFNSASPNQHVGQLQSSLKPHYGSEIACVLDQEHLAYIHSHEFSQHSLSIQIIGHLSKLETNIKCTLSNTTPKLNTIHLIKFLCTK